MYTVKLTVLKTRRVRCDKDLGVTEFIGWCYFVFYRGSLREVNFMSLQKGAKCDIQQFCWSPKQRVNSDFNAPISIVAKGEIGSLEYWIITRHFIVYKCRPEISKHAVRLTWTLIYDEISRFRFLDNHVSLRLSWTLICDEISRFRFLDNHVSRSYKLYDVKHVGLNLHSVSYALL